MRKTRNLFFILCLTVVLLISCDNPTSTDDTNTSGNDNKNNTTNVNQNNNSGQNDKYPADCYSNQIYWAEKQVETCEEGLANAQSATSYVVQAMASSWIIKLDEAEKNLMELKLKQQACQNAR